MNKENKGILFTAGEDIKVGDVVSLDNKDGKIYKAQANIKTYTTPNYDSVEEMMGFLLN